MKVPHLKLPGRASTAVAVVGALVVGLGGWALADGDVPFLSSASDPTTTIAASVGGGGGGADNVAVANNTKDGKTVVAISLKVTTVKSDTVDAGNAAVAVASCTDCETVAIALEGVLVAGDPSTFDPTNIALAINTNCTNCQTLAAAYQHVVQYGTKVRITGQGRKEIAEIRKDLDSLRKSGLDIPAIQQRVNDDAGRFLAVLQNDVVPIGQGADKKAEAGVSPTAAPTTTAPPTTRPQPTSTQPSTTVPPSTPSTTAVP